MSLVDIVNRSAHPLPWSEGDKIPWDDPAFSERMLREHLSQAHDGASRRSETIDAHVAWIHAHLLGGQPTRILDLGCGPGLYTSRLARLGHDCTGIDFSPASIAYARDAHSDIGYVQGDIRTTEYGSGYGLVMLIYGELNVFRPDDARLILRKARAALGDGGTLLLEVHPWDVVRAMGDHPASWRSSPGGLFSPDPYLLLEEGFWDADANVTTHRYYVIDAATAAVTQYTECVQAYSDDAFRELLDTSGFHWNETFGSLRGDDARDELFVIVAQRHSSS
jgi:SAM-dependent methyltransferase